jgi:cytochrome c oxidase subunit II
VSPFIPGWWLPRNVASFGWEIDYLFYVILAFTGFFFVLTEAILVWVMYRYAYRPGQKAVYVEGNHRLEVAWTVVPALILLFIAFAQVKAWEHIKYMSRMPEPEQIVEVMAHQWEWRIRYPAKTEDFAANAKDSPEEKKDRQNKVHRWAGAAQFDDLQHIPNDLHVWKGAKVKIFLKTQDVLHSLFLPQLRLKQDALPGKTIPVWFEATDSNTAYNEQTRRWEQEKDKVWEIACAELCGGRHYAMRGKLYVHPDKEDYEKWLEKARQDEQRRSPEQDPEKSATARR